MGGVRIILRLNGYITNALCRELLGIDDKDSANYILTNMFKKGLLKRTGRGKTLDRDIEIFWLWSSLLNKDDINKAAKQ